MGRLKIKNTLGAVVCAFCLVFISDYVGNALIPPFKQSHQTKIVEHDWIIWPEQKEAPSESNQKQYKTQTTKLIQIPSASKTPIRVLLSSATPEKGRKIARKCVACHSFKKEGKNKIGPNLYNIMGRKRATTIGYNYSKALKQIGGTWGFSDMDKFLLKPKKFLPGTKMSFKGIKNANERAAVIMFLRSFSENPLNLPE